MKAIEQYFSVVLFIILYKVVLAFPSEDEILKPDESTVMKAEQWVFVVLFVFQCFEKWYLGIFPALNWDTLAVKSLLNNNIRQKPYIIIGAIIFKFITRENVQANCSLLVNANTR